MHRNAMAAAAVAWFLGACAAQPPEPPVERKVPVTAENIADVAAAGYRIVDQDGQRLYCEKRRPTGSHLRRETTCLTEAQMNELRDASARGIKAIQSSNPLPTEGRPGGRGPG